MYVNARVIYWYMYEPYPKKTRIRSIYYNDAVQTRQVYKDKLRLQMNEKIYMHTIRQCSLVK